jgi:flagellar L-ring protein precursor FlgH
MSSFWRNVSIAWALGLIAVAPSVLHAENLYSPGSFSALASDRRAQAVGDSLTIVIHENATATNTAQNSSAKNMSVSGQVATRANTQSAQLGLTGSFDGSGQTGRTGKMVAQLSVVVDRVLPNGDLHVSGAQSLNINGERTNIKLAGRVRPADISNTNSVLSTNLAEAVIDYDGKGFVANGSKPGVVARVFGWLGLI